MDRFQLEIISAPIDANAIAELNSCIQIFCGGVLVRVILPVNSCCNRTIMWRLHRRSYELLPAGEERIQASYMHGINDTIQGGDSRTHLNGIPSFIVLQSEKFQSDDRVEGSYTAEEKQCKIV
jgi:hypothetical protein